MSITFMHNFHTKISAVNDISPSINYTTLTINYRLIEIMVLGFWLTYFVNASLAGQVTKYTLPKQLIDLLPTILVTGISFVVTYYIGNRFNELKHITIMILQVIVFIAIYLLLSAIFRIPAVNIYKQIVMDALIEIRNKKHSR